jgi:hypothetical protein
VDYNEENLLAARERLLLPVINYKALSEQLLTAGYGPSSNIADAG